MKGLITKILTEDINSFGNILPKFDSKKKYYAYPVLTTKDNNLMNLSCLYSSDVDSENGFFIKNDTLLVCSKDGNIESSNTLKRRLMLVGRTVYYNSYLSYDYMGLYCVIYSERGTELVYDLIKDSISQFTNGEICSRDQIICFIESTLIDNENKQSILYAVSDRPITVERIRYYDYYTRELEINFPKERSKTIMSREILEVAVIKSIQSTLNLNFYSTAYYNKEDLDSLFLYIDNHYENFNNTLKYMCYFLLPKKYKMPYSVIQNRNAVVSSIYNAVTFIKDYDFVTFKLDDRLNKVLHKSMLNIVGSTSIQISLRKEERACLILFLAVYNYAAKEGTGVWKVTGKQLFYHLAKFKRENGVESGSFMDLLRTYAMISNQSLITYIISKVKTIKMSGTTLNNGDNWEHYTDNNCFIELVSGYVNKKDAYIENLSQKEKDFLELIIHIINKNAEILEQIFSKAINVHHTYMFIDEERNFYNKCIDEFSISKMEIEKDSTFLHEI